MTSEEKPEDNEDGLCSVCELRRMADIIGEMREHFEKLMDDPSEETLSAAFIATQGNVLVLADCLDQFVGLKELTSEDSNCISGTVH